MSRLFRQAAGILVAIVCSLQASLLRAQAGVEPSRCVMRVGTCRNALSRAVFDALRNPRATIDRDPGMSKWLRTEILPWSCRFSEASRVVNDTEHRLSGGLTYRMPGESFTAQGVPSPRVFAAATTFTAAMLNEAAEYTTAERGTAASVAELRKSRCPPTAGAFSSVEAWMHRVASPDRSAESSR